MNSTCSNCGSNNTKISDDMTSIICLNCNQAFESQEHVVSQEQVTILTTLQNIQLKMMNQIQTESVRKIRTKKTASKQLKPTVLIKYALNMLPQVEQIIEKIQLLKHQIQGNIFLESILQELIPEDSLRIAISELRFKIMQGGPKIITNLLTYLPSYITIPQYTIKENLQLQITPELLLSFQLQIFPQTLYFLQQKQSRVKYETSFLITLLRPLQLSVCYQRKHYLEISYILSKTLRHTFIIQFLQQINQIYETLQLSKKNYCIYELALSLRDISIQRSCCAYFIFSIVIFYLLGGKLSQVKEITNKNDQQLYFKVFQEQNQNIQSIIQLKQQQITQSGDLFQQINVTNIKSTFTIGSIVQIINQLDSQDRNNLFLIIQILNKHVNNKFHFEYFIKNIQILLNMRKQKNQYSTQRTLQELLHQIHQTLQSLQNIQRIVLSTYSHSEILYIFFTKRLTESMLSSAFNEISTDLNSQTIESQAAVLSKMLKFPKSIQNMYQIPPELVISYHFQLLPSFIAHILNTEPYINSSIISLMHIIPLSNFNPTTLKPHYLEISFILQNYILHNNLVAFQHEIHEIHRNYHLTENDIYVYSLQQTIYGEDLFACAIALYLIAIVIFYLHDGDIDELRALPQMGKVQKTVFQVPRIEASFQPHARAAPNGYFITPKRGKTLTAAPLTALLNTLQPHQKHNFFLVLETISSKIYKVSLARILKIQFA